MGEINSNFLIIGQTVFLYTERQPPQRAQSFGSCKQQCNIIIIIRRAVSFLGQHLFPRCPRLIRALIGCVRAIKQP